MITDANGGVRMPYANSLRPKVPTAMIGRALANLLDDTLSDPLPERLASLVAMVEASLCRRGRGSSET